MYESYGVNAVRVPVSNINKKKKNVYDITVCGYASDAFRLFIAYVAGREDTKRTRKKKKNVRSTVEPEQQWIF